MKKCCLFLSLVLLCGCACTKQDQPSPTPSPIPSPTSEPQVKKAVDVTGEETQFGTPIVSLTMKDGKITEISIDEITGESTKKQMKDSYQLPESAVAPWIDQIAYLENYILKHDVQSIQTDANGKAVDSDLLSGCTIQIDNYLKTVIEAMNQAK